MNGALIVQFIDEWRKPPSCNARVNDPRFGKLSSLRYSLIQYMERQDQVLVRRYDCTSWISGL